MIDMYGKEFGVNAPLRVAHFLAKAREEITRYTYANRLGMAMVKQMMNKKLRDGCKCTEGLGW